MKVATIIMSVAGVASAAIVKLYVAPTPLLNIYSLTQFIVNCATLHFPDSDSPSIGFCFADLSVQDLRRD